MLTRCSRCDAATGALGCTQSRLVGRGDADGGAGARPPLPLLQIVAGSLWSRVSQARSLFFSLQYLLPLGLAIIADKMQGKEIPGRWHLSPVEWQDSSLPFKYKELVKRKIV